MAEKKPNAPTSLAFSRDELVIVNNALNEICNGVNMNDDELQTRIGYSRETARQVLAKVSKALEKK